MKILNIENLEFFHSDVYRNYYKNRLGKDIVIKIPNKHLEEAYFWRGEYQLNIFERDLVEVFIYSDKSKNISSEQKLLLNNFKLKLPNFISKLKADLRSHSLEEINGEDLSDKELITTIFFRLINLNQIEVELWASFDNEHPIIDNIIYNF